MTSRYPDAPPTPRQLAALRRIAYASQRSFAWPQTRAEASRQISLTVTFRPKYKKKRKARPTQ